MSRRWRRCHPESPTFRLRSSRFELGAQIADRVTKSFPYRNASAIRQVSFDLRFLAGNLFQSLAMIGANGRFTFENALLDGEIVELTHGVFNRGGRGALTKSQPRAGRVQNADRFIGQLASGKIAIRKMHGGGEAFIQNANFVMLLERRDNAAQHGHTLRLNRLFDFHDLETASQRGIFFEIFLVLRPGCGGDRSQLAARQSGLQQIGGVALAGGSSGADHGVRLVDEEDYRRRRRFDFLDQPLQAVFEFTFDPCSRLQECQVEGANGDVAKRWRNIAVGDSNARSLRPRPSSLLRLRR